jgi:AraC family transcriptional regulator of adaptative response/methylated-DNA-[protein]-cysteine methyltransferase
VVHFTPEYSESITHIAFDTGFESLSGFGDSFKNIFGVSPKNGKQQNIIDLKRIETPLGTMLVCATNQGICLLEFTDRKMLETELKSIAKLLNAIIIQGYNKHFETLEIELQEYFNGKRKEFSIAYTRYRLSKQSLGCITTHSLWTNKVV